MIQETAMTPAMIASASAPVLQASGLDHTYTALAEATARLGETNTPLFLATLALALLSRQADTGEALALIAQAERLAAT
jgi:hypothetical protein